MKEDEHLNAPKYDDSEGRVEHSNVEEENGSVLIVGLDI
jgi:hypothetical protein